MPLESLVEREPIIIDIDTPVKEAAQIMKKENIGSLVIKKKGKAVGIVTERDLVTKVMAMDEDWTKITVGDIMSSPLIGVSPDTTVYEAARKMATLYIRRLPLVTDKGVIGIVTETDLLRVSPQLIEFTRSYLTTAATQGPREPVSGISGYCESCGAYNDGLGIHDGMLLCTSCRESRM